MIICLEMFLLKCGDVRAGLGELFRAARCEFRLLGAALVGGGGRQGQRVLPPLPSPNTLKGKLRRPQRDKTQGVAWRPAREARKRKMERQARSKRAGGPSGETEGGRG